MTFRPLSLCPELVPAMLDGRKTMTRRPLRPPPTMSPHAVFHHIDPVGQAVFTDNTVVSCPLGAVGEGLWLRERARVLEYPGYLVRLRYEADGAEDMRGWPARLKPVPVGHCIPNGVHREGSRWSSVIVEARVERVQDITEEDARAEGLEPDAWPDDAAADARAIQAGVDAGHGYFTPRYCRAAFANLWSRLYPGSWERNDLVWVVRWEGRR